MGGAAGAIAGLGAAAWVDAAQKHREATDARRSAVRSQAPASAPRAHPRMTKVPDACLLPTPEDAAPFRGLGCRPGLAPGVDMRTQLPIPPRSSLALPGLGRIWVVTEFPGLPTALDRAAGRTGGRIPP